MLMRLRSGLALFSSTPAGPVEKEPHNPPGFHSTVEMRTLGAFYSQKKKLYIKKLRSLRSVLPYFDILPYSDALRTYLGG